MALLSSRRLGFRLAIAWLLLVGNHGPDRAHAGGGYRVTPVQVGRGSIGAVAYDTAGSLVVLHGAGLTIRRPNGAESSLSVTGATLISPDGGWIDPDTGDLLVVDNKQFNDGQGDLYAIDLDTGTARTIFSGLDTIADVAVHRSGAIFVSSSAGGGNGQVYEVDRSGGGIIATVLDDLEFASGLDFDGQGHLVVVQSTLDAGSQVYRVPITEQNEQLVFGEPELLATGPFPGFDLAIDQEDDIWVTGSGGLWVLDASNGYAPTQVVTTGKLFEFAGEIDFRPGLGPFELSSPFEGSHLTYVPDFGVEDLSDLTVPEPLSIYGLVLWAGLLLGRRCRRPS